MKKLIAATLFTLTSAGALALDGALDPAGEYYGSPLIDHQQPARTTGLGPNHDHGDNSIREFVQHPHALPVREMHPHAMNTSVHDHGDDTIKDFVPHSDS